MHPTAPPDSTRVHLLGTARLSRPRRAALAARESVRGARADPATAPQGLCSLRKFCASRPPRQCLPSPPLHAPPTAHALPGRPTGSKRGESRGARRRRKAGARAEGASRRDATRRDVAAACRRRRACPANRHPPPLHQKTPQEKHKTTRTRCRSHASSRSSRASPKAART